MSSYPKRDPEKDHLITPEKSILVIIDYQPVQINSIKSISRNELVRNIVALAKMFNEFRIPVVLSSVNVKTGYNKEVIPQLRKVLPGIEPLDRTTINAWEDKDVREAVLATGRKKIIIAALWTEACLSFPALDALKEGFEVYAVVDAVGGTSITAHKTALRRMEQAGVVLVSVPQLACELQRDWNREETVKPMVEALVTTGAFLDLE